MTVLAGSSGMPSLAYQNAAEESLLRTPQWPRSRWARSSAGRQPSPPSRCSGFGGVPCRWSSATQASRAGAIPVSQQRGTDSLLMPMLCTPGMAVSAS